MLLYLYLEATPLQCTLSGTRVALEALLIVGFSILIKSTGTKLKEMRKGIAFSGSIELSSENSLPQAFGDARSLYSSEEADKFISP